MAVISIKNKTKSGSLLNGNAPFIPTDYESIETVTVGSGGAGTVTFSSIPSTYSHLQVRYIARSNRGDVQDIIRFRFNSDSGTNYAYHWLRGDGGTADAGNATSTASPWTAIIAGANAGASQFGVGVSDILDYSNTNKYKTTRTLSGVDTNSANGRIMFFSNLWMNTNAITSIEIAPNYGTSFNQYSSFALYGIKG
jgi:hypothetical protein